MYVCILWYWGERENTVLFVLWMKPGPIVLRPDLVPKHPNGHVLRQTSSI